MSDPQMKRKNVKRQQSMSERVDEFKAQPAAEDLFASLPGARPKRVSQKPAPAAAPRRSRASVKAEPPADGRRVQLPQREQNVYHTYALTPDQRRVLEEHAMERFQSGFTSRLDYSEPLRDILEYYLAHEGEVNEWITQKYKKKGGY